MCGGQGNVVGPRRVRDDVIHVFPRWWLFCVSLRTLDTSKPPHNPQRSEGCRDDRPITGAPERNGRDRSMGGTRPARSFQPTCPGCGGSRTRNRGRGVSRSLQALSPTHSLTVNQLWLGFTLRGRGTYTPSRTRIGPEGCSSNWQSAGLQNRMLWVRVPPPLRIIEEYAVEP
jgi:hypothetical protein